MEEKEIILITGSHGAVANQLSSLLENYSLRYLTRKKTKPNEYEWNIEKQIMDPSALEGVKHIVHLAGAGIADGRWSDERKKVIMSSRVDSARLILKNLKDRDQKISTFISGSATGYYGTITSDKIYKESDSKGNDFLSEVCYQWELAADDFLNQNIADRVVKIRTGISLSKNEKGVLNKIKKMVNYYVGARLGSGKQYIPWIHIYDLCSLYKYAIVNEGLQGTYNGVAPCYITNKDLTVAIARKLNKPLFLPNIPGFLLRMLFGEVSSLLLEGSRISSEKICATGFTFRYSDLSNALDSLL
ncbi:hypothetical protein Ga0061079_1118 [Apibacter mensalis]|uniref:TIGR01777 family protein n=1 Tax=Apibacter mensalis TaxID=1586267 RepID=A0A0X3AR11_9FLAO|nr:TIGR01777 family oxidoreductase [Apibacter mensalis]CVK16816.1 hypothetical protein Ga0061079_1118 [Apibacter mensalis]